MASRRRTPAYDSGSRACGGHACVCQRHRSRRRGGLARLVRGGTAIQALHAGFAVEVLQDAIGSLPYVNADGATNAEEMHRVFCVVFHSRFAAVISTSAWIAAAVSR